MRVASVCSSVGGLDLGLHRAGHETVAFCEVDPWRRTILDRHWPGVPVFPDLKELTACDLPACDLLVGGTPCQDLSIAGKRGGLDGERSGLFHAFAQLRLDLYERHGCAWSLWENVEGARSSNAGQDFATVLASHVGADVAVPAGGWPGSGLVIGPWGTAEWRVLDAQFFGVAQRRRRVFVVGHLGADRPVEVLADTARGERHPSASGETWPHAPAGPAGRADVAGSLTARYGKGVDSDASDGQVVVAHTLTAAGFDASEDGTGRGTPIIASALDTMKGGADDNDAQARHIVAATLRSHPRPGSATPGAVVAATPTAGAKGGGPVAFALGTTSGGMGVAISENQRGELVESDVSRALSGGGGKPGQGYPAARVQEGVRRLTPTECERLMGWPDGWTIAEGPPLLDEPQSWPGGDMPEDPRPDGRRYSACGDGVVAHVAEWIGHGLAQVEAASEVADAA